MIGSPQSHVNLDDPSQLFFEYIQRMGHVTVSTGYSRLLPNDTPSDVIDRADEALYYCKHNGRNQSACFETLVDEGKLTPKNTPKSEFELF